MTPADMLADASRGVTRAALTAAVRTSTSPDWGTHPVLRSFAHAVLAPVSGRVDVDAASSAYWQAQWPDDERPTTFLSEERSALSDATWAGLPPGLTAFVNAPGDAQGANVHSFWERGCAPQVSSLFWVGFNLEQTRSLQSHVRHPLSRSSRVSTFVPGSRVPYLVRPSVMAQIIEEKAQRAKASQVARMHEQAAEMRELAAKGDAPVSGGSPTHPSFVTVVWHPYPRIAREQQAAARAFLLGQRADPKSPLRRCAVVGETDVLG